ncbi:fibronectin type III-like domain-contianing protein [Halorhabdus rudnickae]|uniref:fibronectin type III-like domain-contianing protein n=1 Tax=Halorhabdus rudnickae TaxID=1775544 RepID=UPI001083898B|nr:fibronectin type III-like domain-contianing protein [Halorhabdus rudnickae]
MIRSASPFRIRRLYGSPIVEPSTSTVSSSSDAFAPGETLESTGTVENTSDVVGQDVVQLYVRDFIGSRLRPQKELVGFETVELEPGETAAVTIEIDENDLAFWTAEEEWAAESSAFGLMVAHAADDIVHTERFTLDE